MKIPEIVQEKSNEPLKYIGEFKDYEVFEPITHGEDCGCASGYPFVFLYDGKHVEEVCVGTDSDLALWYFEHA